MEIPDNEILIKYDQNLQRLTLYYILKEDSKGDRHALHTYVDLNDLKGKSISEIEQLIGQVVSIAVGMTDDIISKNN